jgi:hypothetical protein
MLGSKNVKFRREELILSGIKMDIQEVGGGGGDWMELAQDRAGWWALLSRVNNLRVS